MRIESASLKSDILCQKFAYTLRSFPNHDFTHLRGYSPVFIQPIMPPRRGKELPPTLRARICELRYCGMSYGKIAVQVSRLGRVVNRSAVQATCHREIERVDNASKPRTGRPRVISEEERDKMYDIVKHEDPFIK